MSVQPLRRQVLVSCDPETAMRLWVEDIGSWWPLDSHRCYPGGGSVAFEGDQIVETSASGDRAEWGAVSVRQPGLLSFSWHPGRDAEQATRVTVSFVSGGREDLTLVTLTHEGWEAHPKTGAARAEYAVGWVYVLNRMVDVTADEAEAAGAGSPATEGKDLWFVLQHTAGPATPPDGVFASPDFRHHVAFLQRLAAEGVLVAGGSLPDSAGSGMTIVRTSGAAQARTVIAAAQLEDGAVQAELLEVLVRPWRVALSGLPAGSTAHQPPQA